MFAFLEFTYLDEFLYDCRIPANLFFVIHFIQPFFFPINPFPNDKFYTLPKFKEFAKENYKYDENGRKFSICVEKQCGKRRNCSSRAISPFPTVFSKDLYCRHVKTQLVWERVKSLNSEKENTTVFSRSQSVIKGLYR